MKREREMKAAEEMTREQKEVKLRMILQDYHRRNDYELQQAVNDILALDALPPAGGAEEILAKYLIRDPISKRSALEAMHEFAALHAQKIADKMVGERLREELMTYDKFLSNTYWGISHITKREEAVDEYLKSRDNENTNKNI